MCLYSANGKELAEQVLSTNEFGSYSGTFIAPVNSLNGIFWIKDNKEGETAFRIEEYKRPKFEVTIDSLSGAYQLGDTIPIVGRALSYSNTTVDQAKVHYTILCFNQTLVSENTVTNNNGEFTIKFKAKEKVSDPSSELFTVKVEITDLNGETHDAQQSFVVSNQPIMIEANIPEEIDKNSFRNFNVWAKATRGKNIPANIDVTITKLKNPEKAYRERLWNFPDTILIPKATFIKYFPKDQYQKQITSTFREKIVYQTKINTDKPSTINLDDLVNWSTGKYIIELQSNDKSGQPITWSKYFIVFSLKDSLQAIPEIDNFELLTATLEVGDTAHILVGSSEPVFALLEVEKDNKIIRQFNIELNNRQKVISFPITIDCVGNVAIHFIFAKDNRLYKHNEIIKVPYSHKKLNIRFETFRNKLYPGEKEEWKIKITDPLGEKVTAEMLATLYDASLDAFTPNSFKLDIFGKYNPKLEWNISHFEPKNESRSNYRYSYFPAYKSNYLPFVSFMNSFLGNENDPESKISLQSFRSQPTLDIEGYVVDYVKGNFLSGVQISFPGLKSSVISDNQGKFSFKAAVKNARLIIEKPGFQKVSMTASGKMKLLVKLAKLDSNTKAKWICQDGTVKFSAPCMADMLVEEPLFCMVGESACFNGGSSKANADLNKAVPRRNFSETAFFFPNLTTNEKGEIIITFTVPESLTRWKMLGLAHTNDLKTGYIENELVTQKELMVYPNFPRFFREGDTLKLMTRVANLAGTAINGNVKLMLFNALDMRPIDSLLGNPNNPYAFVAKENQSATASWVIHFPSGFEAVVCRIVANSDKFSDGEEVIIPVLPNSILVTESLPIFIKGRQNKTFTLNKLVQNKSTTLQNHKLTFEYTTNPAWYALLSLPYLMEFPFECAEQTFSRYYANKLGNFILQSNPKIKSVFNSWKSLPAEQLSDKLEQNQELKSLLLEETPWLRESKSGAARLQQLAKLFDKETLKKEMERCIAKLSTMQNYDGGLSWFIGMPSSRYITQHVVAGIGHLRKIEEIKTGYSATEEAILKKAIDFMDQELLNDYNVLIKQCNEKKLKPEDNHLTELILHDLYARSFFNNSYPIANSYLPAYEYYISQAKKYWVDQLVYNQGMIALILKRQGDDLIPNTIIGSLKERAIVSEELGMHWQNEIGYYWYQAPIEIQSLLIEAFSEAGSDQHSIEEMKLWLLQQKHTQNWHSTKATTEAIYALLLHGANLLTIEPDITISVGEEKILPTPQNKPQPQAGTDYIKTTWEANQITNDMGTVKIKSRSEVASWGALYWQYFEKIENITSAATPLSIQKILLKELHTSKGDIYYPVTDTTKLKPGDLLKVKLEIMTNRDLEYVHLKDMHAEGIEPLEALSGYHWQEGLNYYESPRDVATHFFISHMQKGTYVLEYPLRITMSGNLSNGIATIQCMYAPEFSAHSEGVRIKIE